ncbi:MAG: hypothetical protein RR620_06425 [Clostridium sp.]
MIPFLIIIIGCALVYINLRTIDKDKNNFSTILKDKEDNATEQSLEIMQLRKEMAESLFELQQEIQELREKINGTKEYNETDGVVSEIDFKNVENLSKIEVVEYLLKNGLTDDEICSKLSIGKGEVLFIKGLLKNQRK